MGKPMKENRPIQEKGKRRKKKRKGPSISTIILTVIMLAGVGILLYPTVSDWWNSMHASRAIASYVENVENISSEECQAMLEEAYEYNAKLSGRGLNFLLTEEEQEEYNSVLNISGTGVMGYIQIPSINVNLPVYHGTDEAILQIAIGHISGSSLPVGGTSSHCVVSGHRGLPSARLFTDIDQMKESDVFMLTVLDQTITYQVDQIRIVLPEEVDELAIVPGEDYCTLVTCTPYGVNTHRMLVRGHRIDNLAGEVVVVAEAVKIPTYVVIPAIGIPLLFLLLTVTLIYYGVKKPPKSRQQMLEELRKEK